MGEIYKITNLINGKCYIGKTKYSSVKRWVDHINGYHPNSLIHKAISKYGVDNFSFEIIEHNICTDKLNNYETDYIKLYNCKSPNGYNLTDGGDGGKGFVITDEWRRKQSECKKGKPWSEKRKIAGQSKLIGNDHASKSIIQLDINTNEIIGVYKSISEANRSTGVGRTAISKAVNGKLKTAGGYKWEFIRKEMLLNGSNHECKKRCIC